MAMREPRGQSMAYTMAVGVGRGKPVVEGSSSVVSNSTRPVYAGRGAMMQEQGREVDYQQTFTAQMANAQRPYEQYLVSGNYLLFCLH